MNTLSIHSSPSITHNLMKKVSLLLLISAGLLPACFGGETDKPESPTAAESAWRTLFDGKTLNGWKVIGYGGHGEVAVEEGKITMGMGANLTGILCTNDLPKTNYEAELEAMKLQGSDFFCGWTFPVQDSFCTFIVGGWGGGIVGLSSIDGYDASENETARYESFSKNRWYRIRIRVTPERIQTWIDDEQYVNQDIIDRKVSLRFGEIEDSKPFGISAWVTGTALRGIRIRAIPATPKSPSSLKLTE